MFFNILTHHLASDLTLASVAAEICDQLPTFYPQKGLEINRSGVPEIRYRMNPAAPAKEGKYINEILSQCRPERFLSGALRGFACGEVYRTTAKSTRE
jgi:hypothetical protein